MESGLPDSKVQGLGRTEKFWYVLASGDFGLRKIVRTEGTGGKRKIVYSPRQHVICS